jgi:hypothetical protein
LNILVKILNLLCSLEAFDCQRSDGLNLALEASYKNYWLSYFPIY